MQYRLGFIGCGNMAQAIANGAIKQGVLSAQDIIASDPSDTNRDLFESWGCTTTADNRAVVEQPQQVLLAVKPQIFPQVAPDLSSLDTDGQGFISIMAGLSSEGISQAAGMPCRGIRVISGVRCRKLDLTRA